MAFVATQYTMTAARTEGESGYAPKDWVLEGSNDNTNWTTLDSVTGEAAWGALTTRTYTIDSPAAYRYYRWTITSNQVNTVGTSISQLELLVSGTDVIPALTTYTAAPSWTVTYSNDNGGSSSVAAWRAFDDVVDDSDRWLTQSDLPGWIEVDDGIDVPTVTVTPTALSVNKQTPAVLAALLIAVPLKVLTVTTKTPVFAEASSATVAITPTAVSVTAKTPAIIAGVSLTVMVAPKALSVTVKAVGVIQHFAVSVISMVTTAATINVMTFPIVVQPVALEVRAHKPMATTGTSGLRQVAPIAHVIWPKLIIEVHDATGSVKYQDIAPDINGLQFSSKDGVGYDTCTFPIVRDVRFSYPDLSIGNKIKLSAGDRVAWEGLANSVNIQAADDTGIEVTCFGYFALLTKRINATPLTTGMRGSDWILANLIEDTDLEFERGNIYTDDYIFPADLDLGDDLYYNTILAKINEYNGFVMGVGADRKFDFYPKPSMISYKVRMEDCHTSLMYERDSITNYVLVKYTTDGVTYPTFWWPDDGPEPNSAALYGRCDGILVIEEYCTEAMAQQKAEVALRAGTTMRPASDLTLERIYDVNTGVESDVRLVKPGSLVFIEDLASVQTSVNDAATLNEMSTFAIAETEFDVESGEVTA